MKTIGKDYDEIDFTKERVEKWKKDVEEVTELT